MSVKKNKKSSLGCLSRICPRAHKARQGQFHFDQRRKHRGGQRRKLQEESFWGQRLLWEGQRQHQEQPVWCLVPPALWAPGLLKEWRGRLHVSSRLAWWELARTRPRRPPIYCRWGINVDKTTDFEGKISSLLENVLYWCFVFRWSFLLPMSVRSARSPS